MLILVIILAYILFSNPSVQNFISNLGSLSYLGIFIAGMFFSFGFTAPFSAGFFLILNTPNIWIAGIIGGLGALISDLLIFEFIKISFKDEFNLLKKTKIMKSTGFVIQRILGAKITNYLVYLFAGILIASPLPDEIGIIILAGLTRINLKILTIISFVLNTIGIIILLAL